MAKGLEIRETMPQSQLLDCFEAWAGESEICKHMLAEGLAAKASDISFGGASHDICQPAGLAAWHSNLLRVRPGGLLWQGVDCKSFVFVSRRFSKRTRDDPFGDVSRPFVVHGNYFSLVAVWFMLIASFLEVWSALEQPRSSNFPFLPYVDAALQELGIDIVHTHLGSYKGPSAKPIKVYTSALFLVDLWAPRPPAHGLLKLVRRNKKPKRVDGMRKALTMSAKYPKHFGWAVARLLKEAL